MSIHVLVIGGEDHNLRLPFMLHLQDRGFRVTAAGSGSPVPFEAASVQFRHLRFARFVDPLADWRALSAIRSLVADVRPDVVQCFDTKLNVLVPIALRNCARHPAIVRTINGRGWLYSSRSISALLLRLAYSALHRVASRWTRVEIFQHGEDKAFFEAGGMVGKGGAVIIPGSGIDISGFERSRAAGPAPEVLRAELGLGDARVVMTVTRLTRHKGIGSLLAAAADVHRTHPDVRFVLVGPRESEGPLAISEAEIMRHAPYVIATGPRADVPALLGLADLFVFPTEYREGVPRALCEAALAGVPIVTTDMPGCLQVIRDGWSGCVVPAHAPARLAAAIRRVLDDRDAAKAMALNGFGTIHNVFSLPAVVASYAAVYDAVARTSFGTPMSEVLVEALP